MGNIALDSNGLSETISLLENDNNEIIEIIDKINKAIIDMDEKKWSAPNKKKIDEELLPYIDHQKMTITNELNNCISVLKYALNLYSNSNSHIGNESSKLENYNN